jgi:hypothetical protein
LGEKDVILHLVLVCLGGRQGELLQSILYCLGFEVGWVGVINRAILLLSFLFGLIFIFIYLLFLPWSKGKYLFINQPYRKQQQGKQGKQIKRKT